MDEVSKAGRATAPGESLEQVGERFKRWRKTRRRGEHVPPSLWAAAVVLAQEHGVHRIALELRVDHEGLNRRMERAGGVARVGQLDTRFVELFAAPPATAAGVRECVVELESARGAKMRVELNGKGLAGLAGLCSAFWSAS